ncbi:MAG TPA: hypothetical protein VGH32_10375 [Pirellulales bacterium]
MHSIDDTIAAIASAAGGAARGIVRISGPEAVPIVAKLFTPAKDDPDNPSSSAALADLRIPTRIRGSVGMSLADRSDEQRLLIVAVGERQPDRPADPCRDPNFSQSRR